MTTNAKIGSDIQQASVGRLVELYELDASTLGDTVYFFTPTASGSPTAIQFNNQVYSPIHMESNGWESSSDGKMPRPIIRVSNVSRSFAAGVLTYNDFLGATLTRRRTFTKYLDGQPNADSNAEFPQDIYIVDRKIHHSKYYIEWELVSLMDIEGFKIPKRQVLRDTCTHFYRYYDTSTAAFDYTNTTCPYIASGSHAYFSRLGDNVVDASNDKCGKRLEDCKLRYPNITGPVTVSDTEPVAPNIDDNWLNTSVVPNRFMRYSNTAAPSAAPVNDWINAKTETLPTRAFPSVAKLRVRG